MNKYIDIAQAISFIKSGDVVLVGGFMTCGTPEVIIDALVNSEVNNLTIICNDAGYEAQGVGKLIQAGKVKKLIASHIGLNPLAGKKMNEADLDVELVPQGTLAERIRAGGVGLGGILTPTGVGTIVEEGKKIITVEGVDYLLETPIKADVALVYADTCDAIGNLVYSKTTRNFNPIMCMAAEKVIVFSKKHVDRGQMDPEVIVTPHIFVDHIIEEDAPCHQ